MKYSNFILAPTVVGLGKSDLEKRIISIMSFKKPTILTIALSAFMVCVCGTAAFAVSLSPKPETDGEKIAYVQPAVAYSRPNVTTSEPVLDNSQTEKSEPTASVNEPASESIPEIDETNIDSENPEIDEPEPVEPDNTGTILLKWEDGLETPPDSNYLELSKSDKNGNETICYLPLSISDETIVVCETAIKISIPSHGDVPIYVIGHNSDDNGNNILRFVPVYELMPVMESTYAQEKMLDDVIIRG